jgi:hypothetical protein
MDSAADSGVPADPIASTFRRRVRLRAYFVRGAPFNDAGTLKDLAAQSRMDASAAEPLPTGDSLRRCMMAASARKVSDEDSEIDGR